MSATEVIDLNTMRGIARWVKDLPTENLIAIAARPLDMHNALLVLAAGGELIVRGVEPPLN